MSLRVGSVLLLGIAGCFPYAYPTFETTVPVPIAREGRDDVRAFRVDIEAQHGLPIYGSETRSLREVKLLGGIVPAQMTAGLDSGLVIIGALSYHFHYHDAVHLLLYRRGFQTISVKAWQLGDRIEWHKANSIADCEKAIDELVAHRNVVPEHNLFDKAATQGPVPGLGGLRTGDFSNAHRQAMLFIAREYEELATRGGIGEPDDTRVRLENKAQLVQKRADERTDNFFTQWLQSWGK